MNKAELYREMLSSLLYYLTKLVGENVTRGIVRKAIKPVLDKNPGILGNEEMPDILKKHLEG
jgi:hypothetical protein